MNPSEKSPTTQEDYFDPIMWRAENSRSGVLRHPSPWIHVPVWMLILPILSMGPPGNFGKSPHLQSSLRLRNINGIKKTPESCHHRVVSSPLANNQGFFKKKYLHGCFRNAFLFLAFGRNPVAEGAVLFLRHLPSVL